MKSLNKTETPIFLSVVCSLFPKAIFGRLFHMGVCFVIVCSPSHSFGSQGRLWFVIVAFPAYLHIFMSHFELMCFMVI